MSHRLSPLLVAALAGALLALPAAAAAAGPAGNPWLEKRVINFTHQGGEDEYPSGTLYALKASTRRGADMLEIDVGSTRDGQLVVLHDNTVDRTTNGTGRIDDLTLAQAQRLDAAYWFVPGRNAVKGLPAARYPFRGVRTGQKRPPRGSTRNDFRIPSLDEVLRAFPDTPMNIEIKGRDGDDALFLENAELLARKLRAARRTDIIAVSFNQKAVDRFHALAPRIPVAPGIEGMANFILNNGGSPGPGVVAFQVPITFRFGGQLLTITTPDFVKRAHEANYAVHVWLSNDTEDVATYRRLLNMCVDGIMAARPNLLERLLRQNNTVRPDKVGNDPCGTRVRERNARIRSDALSLTLQRRGLSQERRSGTVTLRAPLALHGVRRGGVLGQGRYSLATGAASTTLRIRLNAAGRHYTDVGHPMDVRAEVDERAPVSRRTITVSG